MRKADILRSWGRILKGKYPSLSIEITRECPLRCPGCYAYQHDHLGTAGPLRNLTDYKGEELIERVLNLVRKIQPLHISIVGGEPLVRFRELDVLLPQLSKMGIAVQLVTSAVRPIPKAWAEIKDLHLVVSVDGLQPDHDKRRTPATYERILQNIVGHSLKIHCTITHQMTVRKHYFEEFLRYWSDQKEVRQIWISIFTPQKGEIAEEILSQEERERVVDEFVTLRPSFPKLFFPNAVVAGYKRPPKSPEDCIFAGTTLNITADLKSKIAPCQFGGNPDCSNCGCLASAGLNAVGDHRILGVLPVRTLYNISAKIGKKFHTDRQSL
jgi:sulfatase maturation enzyme AslB (radical SAM superfamily)